MSSKVRLQRILNHLSSSNCKSRNDDGTRVVEKLKILKDYECRLVTEDDYRAIIELCTHIYDGKFIVFLR